MKLKKINSKWKVNNRYLTKKAGKGEVIIITAESAELVRHIEQAAVSADELKTVGCFAVNSF